MIKTRIFQFVGHIHNMQLCIEMISFINHENESILRWFYRFCEPRNFSLCPRNLVGVYSGGLGVWFMTFCCCLVEFGSSCFNHAWIESWFVWFGPWYSTIETRARLPQLNYACRILREWGFESKWACRGVGRVEDVKVLMSPISATCEDVVSQHRFLCRTGRGGCSIHLQVRKHCCVSQKNKQCPRKTIKISSVRHSSVLRHHQPHKHMFSCQD